MCGRFAFTASKKELLEHFSLSHAPPIEPSYNIAPGQDIAAIRQAGTSQELVLCHWGLIPSWSKDKKIAYKMINARAESVGTKSAFRNAFRKRRCLIPATGFFEWQKKDGKKQPWFLRLKDQETMAFAGLWEHWEGTDGEVIESCTIITTEANELIRPIHQRMPVIIEKKDYDIWLAAPTSKMAESLLRPFPSEKMLAYPVSTYVNNPQNNNPLCIKPLTNRK